jgi:hypothetical protein
MSHRRCWKRRRHPHIPWQALSLPGRGWGIGATLGVSTSVLRGTALNISAVSDLAGTYTGVGGGAAVAAGVSGVRLRNEKGVELVLRGAKLGVEVSANLALITITMK